MQIWVEIREPAQGITEEEARDLAARVLRELGMEGAELSLLLVDDREMARLNLQFLGRDGTTNVMAFSQLEGEGPPPSSHKLLGDVVICLDTCGRESRDAGISFHQRFLELLVHGVLHLLGHEHEADRHGAALMALEERRVLEAMGLDGGPGKKREPGSYTGGG